MIRPVGSRSEPGMQVTGSIGDPSRDLLQESAVEEGI